MTGERCRLDPDCHDQGCTFNPDDCPCVRDERLGFTKVSAHGDSWQCSRKPLGTCVCTKQNYSSCKFCTGDSYVSPDYRGLMVFYKAPLPEDTSQYRRYTDALRRDLLDRLSELQLSYLEASAPIRRQLAELAALEPMPAAAVILPANHSVLRHIKQKDK